MIRLTEAWFEFKGIRSDAMGIMLAKMPTRAIPAERGAFQTVSGRSGAVWSSDGGYEMIEIRMECDVPDGRMDAISQWLTGEGLLRFSDEPGRAYEARIARSFQRTNPVPRFTKQRFTVSFTCQPFRLLYPAASAITVTSSGTVLDFVGTAPAQPRVEIRGRGDFMVTVGRTTMFFTDISEGIIVDSELMDALSLDGASLMNNHVSGDFFELDPGFPASVSWIVNSGSVSSVTITPRWRYF